MSPRIFTFLSLPLLAAAGHAAPPSDAVYKAELSQWRKAVEDSLKRDEGWLSVAGLFWLKDGVNRVGTKPGYTVRLPAGAAPEDVGTLALYKGDVFFQVNTFDVLVNGQPFTAGGLRSDAKQKTDKVKIGRLTFKIIERGKRIGVRLYDPKAQTRTSFKGLRWYPADRKYAIKAKFVAYPKPRMIPITNVLGDTAPVPSPGYVTFTLGGKPCRLDAMTSGDGLFFNFQDATSGTETYGAGRFLDAPAAKNGTVLLDFNRATNPPCAFTAFATCPLPPKGNRLPTPVRAGELDHHPGK